MKTQALPSQDLLKSIYGKYYLKEGDSQSKYVSSHWKLNYEKFNVQLDGEGNVQSLEGTGFGYVKIRDPLAKLLSYICYISYLVKLSSRFDILRLMVPSFRVCRAMQVFLSFDCFKQICSLALIIKNMSIGMKKKRLVFLIVGDGYGFLSSLIKFVFPNSTIVLVDIGKTLLFQAFYCQTVHPESVHKGVNEDFDIKTVDFLYCPCEYLEKLDMFKYDILINIVSMQEMNYLTIKRYFCFFRKYCNTESLFYCCNRELKILPAGEVSEFKKYPWEDRDEHLIDEYCPWCKYALFYQQRQNVPRIFSVKGPFIHYFDEPIMHRLTVLSGLSEK